MAVIENLTQKIEELDRAIGSARRILLTAPGAADGDSIGSQLALRRVILHRNRACEVLIINDEPLPRRYRFLANTELVLTPESVAQRGTSTDFDVAILVDGGIDRTGRTRAMFEQATAQVFIDHHIVSADYPYTISIVDPDAASTTELIYRVSQAPAFAMPLDAGFAREIYLGLVFDTGFFRHPSTKPESLELAARLIRTGFDFTGVGEAGMLERTYAGLQLLASTVARAQLEFGGKLIWSTLHQQTLRTLGAEADDREGIIDHLFLTTGVVVALLFFEQPAGQVKVSLRSRSGIDVARFARSITESGGGHSAAAGALLEMPVDAAIAYVLGKIEETGLISNSSHCGRV